MKRELTPKQIEHNRKIIKKSMYVPKALRAKLAQEQPLEFLDEKLRYLDNCIYWIREYKEGHIEKQRLLVILDIMETHVKELKRNL